MSERSPITTHVLDLGRGRPASGIAVVLEHRPSDGGEWRQAARARTDDDGRVEGWLPPGAVEPGVYRIRFDLAGYFAALEVESFYPEASVVFTVGDGGGHYHVPLLLSPWGYSTYRGS